MEKFDHPFKSLLQTLDKAIKASTDDNKNSSITIQSILSKIA